MGGPAGSVFTRGLGGFAGGMGWGMAGAGLLAAGMGVRAFFEGDRQRVAAAVAREQRTIDRETTGRTIAERVQARAAGGLKFAGSLTRIIARGRTDQIPDIVAGGKRYGLSPERSLSAMDAADRFKVDPLMLMEGLESGLLGDSPEGVAKKIRASNGLDNAVAAEMGVGRKEARTMIDRVSQSGFAQNIRNAQTAMAPVEEDQMFSLLNNETAAALSQTAQDAMDPAAKLARDAMEKFRNAERLLRAAADEQGAIASLFATFGEVMGGQGSAQDLLNRHRRTMGDN